MTNEELYFQESQKINNYEDYSKAVDLFNSLKQKLKKREYC